MFEKKMGFMVQSTTRQRLMDIKSPGMITQFQAVLVADSIIKAMQEAIQQCPSDREIIALSVSEVSVFIPAATWDIKKEEAKKHDI